MVKKKSEAVVVVEPKAKPEKNLVWVKCRAKDECPGTQAESVVLKIPGNPDMKRLKCVVCGGKFQLPPTGGEFKI